jgi:PAS domain-containing protein
MVFETGNSVGDLLQGGVLAHVIEGAPVGFGMHDSDRKVTYVNRYLTELLGFEVFDELVEGKSVREIAEGSSISEHTVRNHIKASYLKLGVHSRLDLTRVVMGGSPNRDRE